MIELNKRINKNFAKIRPLLSLTFSNLGGPKKYRNHFIKYTMEIKEYKIATINVR